MHYCVPTGPSRSDKEEFAAYASDMLLDLQDMASIYGMGMLAYLVEMAAMEAGSEVVRLAAARQQAVDEPPTEPV